MSEQWTCFGADQPSGRDAAEFRLFVGEHRWIFAATMPHNPHESTLRRNTTKELFEERCCNP